MLDIKRILVPVDFSACSRAAFEYAVLLSSKLGAEVDVVHIFEPPPYLAADVIVEFPGKPHVPYSQYLRELAQKDLSSMLSSLSWPETVRVQGRLETGKAYPTILRLADNPGYDLIVIGTHGRSGIRRLVIGSVAERVVRHSPCPVLTVRASETDAEREESANE